MDSKKMEDKAAHPMINLLRGLIIGMGSWVVMIFTVIGFFLFLEWQLAGGAYTLHQLHLFFSSL